jgi:hypothetical protein
VSPWTRLLTIPLGLGLCLSCSSSSNSTGPSKPGISGTYVGALASAAASGSFVASFGSAASEAAPRLHSTGNALHLHPESGNGSSVTITLLNGTTLTLTGTSNGSNFSVSDNNGDSCTGTAANILNATCSLGAYPGLTLPLVGVLGSSEIASSLTTYCGTDTTLPGSSVSGSVLLGVADTQAFLVNIVAGTNAENLYSGSASSGTLALNASTGSGSLTIQGTYTSTTATGTFAGTSGAVANWAAVSPCVLVAATLSPSTLSFTAATAGTAPPPQVVVMHPNTVGPVTAVIPPADTNWLSATTSGDTVTFNVSTAAAAGSYSASVTIYGQFASSAPTATVNYTVSGASTGGGTFAGLFLTSADGQAFGYTTSQLATTNATPAVSGGGGAISGAGFLAADANANMWTSSGFRAAIFLVPNSQIVNSSNFNWTNVCQLPTPESGTTPAPSGIAIDQSGTVWVADSANPGWFYGYSTSAVTSNCPVSPTTASQPTNTYHLTSVNNSDVSVTGAVLMGMAFDAGGNLYIADQNQGFVYKFLAGQLTGSNLALSADVAINVISEGGDQSPHALAFDANGNLWVSYLGHGSIEEYTAGQLGGTGATYPIPATLDLVTGVADSITSLAFDGSGNLWFVEGAHANANTGLAFAPASQLASGTLTPTVTFTENSGGAQGALAAAFAPAPTGLSLASRAPRRPLTGTSHHVSPVAKSHH